MTSKERHENRYQRRKAAREAKKRAVCAEWDCYDKVFTYDHLYASYRKCRRGVGWKASVQRYGANATLNVCQTYAKLKNRKFKPGEFYEFDIWERGKPRHIRSVSFRERVVQRCLCDYSLVPMISRSFIYDNGACLQGKGYDFSRKRCVQHLRKHYAKYGNEGYVLVFDFRHFFDNVSHEEVFRRLERVYEDSELLSMVKSFVNKFGDIGLGLGSQISQVLALASADRLDHFIKEELRIRGYGRYMDDGYLIHPSKEYLQYCLKEIRAKCEELGIVLNESKTHIIPLRRGFTFLKVRTILTDSGRILCRPWRSNITRMRRKLKKLKRKVDEGIMTVEDVFQSLQSWRSHLIRMKAYRTIRAMEKLFFDIFARKNNGR